MLTFQAITLVLASSLSSCIATAPKSADRENTSPTAMTPAAPAAPSGTAANLAKTSTYQLQDCKPEQGWAIVGGRCDSYGIFQGAGTGVRGALLFTGTFVAGLPHGKGRLCLRVPEKDQDHGLPADCGNSLACEVEFSSGRLSAKEMVCQKAGGQSAWGARAGLQIKLRSPAGFFIDDAVSKQKDTLFHGKVSTITTDLAEVEINGQISFEPLNIADSLTSASAVGELRQVSLSAAEVTFDRFSGQLVIPSRNVRGGGGVLRVKGVFNGQITRASVRFSPHPTTITNNGAIARESIVDLAVSGKHYQLVYAPRPGKIHPGEVLYFKDDEGVEFDGTYPGCAERNRRFGFAQLEKVTESSTFLAYKLKPMCGKITTPSGSYAGQFRNGRPVGPR
ncbi:MAG: hypothetical protein L6Q69_21425 [Zoogloea sp.]|nr:hypothetical protein [Zoogloea sp.]